MNSFFIKSALCAALLLAPKVAHAVSIIDGPIVSPTDGHIYYLLAPASWTDSEAAAVSLGGHLTAITSATENAFVYSTFSTFAGAFRDLWIGLTDVAQPGVFKWTSGEPFSYAPPGSGLPSNSGGEYYVHIVSPDFSSAAVWNDFPNAGYTGRRPNGVVEIVPEPSSAVFLLSGAAFLLRRRSFRIQARNA